MAFFLMPYDILLQAVRSADLTSLPVLYKLRYLYVTITALRVRLERLSLLYVNENGHLYPHRQENEGQLRFRS